MNKLFDKIEDLGGVNYKSERENLVKENDTNFFKNNYSNIEEILLDFISDYGFSFFNNDVELVDFIQPPPPISKSDPSISIGMIFGFGESKNSVSSIIRQYHKEEFIQQDFFPICEGVAGDIIFYSLEQSTFGKIFYWHHESDINDDVYLLADSFEKFILNLKQAKNKAKIESSPVKISKISPKMLELMNKTRIKNGLPPLTMDEIVN